MLLACFRALSLHMQRLCKCRVLLFRQPRCEFYSVGKELSAPEHL